MSRTYSEATILMHEFADALNELSAAERSHLLCEIQNWLNFCKSCGYSDCHGNCERDE